MAAIDVILIFILLLFMVVNFDEYRKNTKE
jgi:hypothetical protein